MALPQMGKTYLVVFCKHCNKGFRVVDEPVFEGKEIRIKRETATLKCRGCGKTAEYHPHEMRIAKVGTKEDALKRKADAERR